MAATSAQNVKDLREKTGAPMMDCKKALQESDGDMDAAVEYLRKAGIMKAQQKAGRAASEGLIAPFISGNVAAMVEICCETDFAAKNEEFGQFVKDVARRVAEEYKEEGDLSSEVQENEAGNVGELVGKIGENVQVNRVERWTTQEGMFDSYVHMEGKIGVLVEAEGDVDQNVLHDVSMHIAAYSPQYISPEDVPEDVLEKEKDIARAQVEGKPENIVEKIVSGKIEKWYTEACLTKQPWLRDDKSSLEKVAPNLKVKRFRRWQAGGE